jgi:hypothetical protein
MGALLPNVVWRPKMVNRMNWTMGALLHRIALLLNCKARVLHQGIFKSPEQAGF